MLQAINVVARTRQSSSLYCVWVRSALGEDAPLVAIWIDREMCAFRDESVTFADRRAFHARTPKKRTYHRRNFNRRPKRSGERARRNASARAELAAGMVAAARDMATSAGRGRAENGPPAAAKPGGCIGRGKRGSRRPRGFGGFCR